jgi:hypothetical protein
MARKSHQTVVGVFTDYTRARKATKVGVMSRMFVRQLDLPMMRRMIIPLTYL